MKPTECSSPASALPASCSEGIVFLVDDDLSVRRALKLLISSAGWQPAICASANEFLELPQPAVPSCLVLDVGLPDINGLELQQLVADRAEMPIIFITGDSDVPVTVRAMKAGAVEFLTKPFGDDVFLNAIRDALNCSSAAIRRQAEAQALRDCYGSLTRREREVMTRVVCGRLNKQVANELGISEVTVKVHRGNMMEKMHASSFLELVKMAVRLGLIPATRG
jgi:FixJ family two-component response regulator